MLVRNPNYWGTKAKLKRVIFRPIGDSAARLQALQSGELDGNTARDRRTPAVRGNSKLKVLADRLHVGYVGINQSNPADEQPSSCGGGRLRARPGELVVGAFYGGRGRWRTSSCRRALSGYAKKGVPDYPYDPDEGRRRC